MALVIEDGTQVAGANSYVTAAEAKAFAAARGVTSFPTVDAEVETLLTLAIDYLEAKRSEYRGTKTSVSQSLQYPRIGSTVDGLEIANNVIPIELKNAQMQLAIEANEYGDLAPSSDGYAIAVEKIDAIEVQYAAGGRLSGTSLPAEMNFPKVDAWLEALVSNGFSNFMSTFRV